MAFLQVITYRTSKVEEMRALDAEWEAATKGSTTAKRLISCEDRDRPGTYVDLVFFDSYESAMKNSNLPETSAMAEKMGALCDGEPTFYNLDITEDKAL